jgi:hypothetical protein
MAGPIKFIFIATADDGAFEDAATARALELCKKFYDLRLTMATVLLAPAVLRFIHFKNNTNEIRAFDFPLSTTATPKPPGTIAWKSLATFVAAGDASFAPTFVDTATPLDILNLYHSIRGAPPGSVLELSIYAHGWTEGPILRKHALGSNDNRPPGPKNGLPMRNPNDRDGRARTDFADNMGEDPTLSAPPGFPRKGGKNALAEFKAAFDKNAVFLICGCNGQDAVRINRVDAQGNPILDVQGNLINDRIGILKATATQVINQAYTLPTQANEQEKKKKTKSAAAKFGAILARGEIPTGTIEIDMGAEFASEKGDILRAIQSGDLPSYTTFDKNDLQADKNRRLELHYELDPTFFPPVSRTNGVVDNLQTTKFSRSFAQVQGVVARRMQLMYGFKAASKLGIMVLAGPVGVKSSVIPDKQMQVCGETPVSECTRALGFHEQFMGIAMGQRKYFVFDQAAVDHINDLALL